MCVGPRQILNDHGTTSDLFVRNLNEETAEPLTHTPDEHLTSCSPALRCTASKWETENALVTVADSEGHPCYSVTCSFLAVYQSIWIPQ